MKRFLKNFFFARKRRKPRSLKEKFPQHDIGRGSYGHFRVRHPDETTKLKIGAFCSFAAGVQIFLGGEHRTDWVTTFPFPVFWDEVAADFDGWAKTRGDVIIGNDVWIGTEALVMSGVRVGNGAVIGARAVVAGDVPPYAIVAGVPAKLVRMRFDAKTIARLEAIAWWNWDDKKIARFMPHILSGDVDSFLDLAERDCAVNEPLLEPES